MSEEFSTDRTDELKRYGFKSGVVISFTEPNFDVTALTAALFESTYSSPKTIPVKLSEPYTAQVAVDAVRAVYMKDQAAEVLQGVEVHYEWPDWYIEGWIQERTQRVRLYAVAGGDARHMDEVFVQVVSNAPEADGPIYYIRVD